MRQMMSEVVKIESNNSHYNYDCKIGERASYTYLKSNSYAPIRPVNTCIQWSHYQKDRQSNLDELSPKIELATLKGGD